MGLWADNRRLKKRINSLPTTSANHSSGGSAAELADLRRQLDDTRDRLTRALESDATSSRKRLEVMEQIESIRSDVRTSTAQADIAKKERDEAVLRAAAASENEARHREANELLRKEIETLRPAVSEAQEKLRAAEAERDGLIEKMRAATEAHMAQLNAMTEELKTVRARAGSRSSRGSSDAWVDVKSSTGIADGSEGEAAGAAGGKGGRSLSGEGAGGGLGDSLSSYAVPDVPRRFQCSVSAHGTAANDVQFSEDGSFVYTAGADGRVTVVDAVTGKVRGNLSVAASSGASNLMCVS